MNLRKLHQPTFDTADCLMQTLANAGYWPDAATKILDYGCGEGALTYSFRDKGFQSYGFDIHDRVAYRAPEDSAWFGFISKDDLVRAEDTSDYTLKNRLRLPFSEGTFDIVVSTSVLEHVIDIDAVLSEIARVLKPGGISLHIYPQMAIIVEPHIYVPFASFAQPLRGLNWPYFYLWALLGVRNEFQRRMSAVEAANNNALYCRTGLRYRSKRHLKRLCSRYFRKIRYVEDAFYAKDFAQASVWERIRTARREGSGLADFALNQRLSMLLTAEKH